MIPLQSTLNIGLKEWAIVGRAHATGRQVLLLRKGGISESSGGFEIEHRQFLFFPTYLHQKLDMLKLAEQKHLEARTTEPDEIELSSAGEITDIIQLKSREQMNRLDEYHIWTAPLLDMRFNYKPMNPLYLLLVRSYKLARSVKVINTPEYAGCKSWVPLTDSVDTTGATPALDDRAFEIVRNRILGELR